MSDTERLQVGRSVDGLLRDRIAAALATVDNWGGHADKRILADAVIEELGLEQEDGECGYCRAQLPGFRYVTDWIADE